MHTDTNPAAQSVRTAAFDTLVDNLRNAHALEKQVISVLEAQVRHLDAYPDMQAQLTSHVAETRQQARRLEVALESCGESRSMLKDAFLSVMGMSQSSFQSFSEDAVLKALTADTMTEQLEIATYRSLIVLADLAGKPDLRPALEESLREEEAMAAWLDENLEQITRRYVELTAAEDDLPATATTSETGDERAPKPGQTSGRAQVRETSAADTPRSSGHAASTDTGQARAAAPGKRPSNT